MSAKHIDIPTLQKEVTALDGGRYKLESKIGSGSYGVVVQALDTVTNEKVAIKRVSPEIFQDVLLARRILREIKLLAHFDHENIIGLRALLKPKDANFDFIYIVMDIMETDLKSILKSGQPISESHVQYFTYQILRGLDCIHKADVIHRDLTPSNILLNTNCDLKICDFGLAREESKGDERELTDYVVMRWYRAPELVMEHKHYNSPVDVWACGCIMGEMLHRNKPVFPGKDRIHQLDVILEVVGTPPLDDINRVGSVAAQKYIKRKPRQPGVDFTQKFQTPEGKPLSADCIDILKRMLTFCPDRRISVHEALNHPYFADLHDPEDELACRPPRFTFADADLNDVDTVKQHIYDAIESFNKKRPVHVPATVAPPPPAAAVDKADVAAGRRESFRRSPHLKPEDGLGGRTALQKQGEGGDMYSDTGEWSGDE
eukprot:TRINITY_DN30587_c0_g1_i1.p1 TRINITY_DN30587_c0_g1~~TRINITY_DN30587_c0_g1_i1.p1  ORF type:complete len:431 (-),score=66.50 TRINITY_DN30587_c0_g1_i1:4-1296(-)